MQFIGETDVKNKKVLLRADFNVDLDENGKILSDFRIRAVLPTIDYLFQNGASRIIIISHLGKPKAGDEKLTLKPVGEKLQQLLGKPVVFLDDCRGEKIKKAIGEAANSSTILLENLRFYPEEENNDNNFAKELASLADIYVNDAFGVCHRLNASVAAVTKFLPSFAGLLLKKEIENLNKVMAGFERPLVLILGGAKISTKLPLIKSFSAMADSILLAGALVNTVLKAWNFSVGQSLVEDEMISEASQISSGKAELILPGDFLVGSSMEAKAAEIRRLGEVQDEDWILDIGPASQVMFSDIIRKAKTIVWNGPMGYFENPVFSEGTKKVIEAVAASSAFSVVGGGETLTALEEWSFFDKISFVSTGGGAMLSYLAGEKMPGIEALN
jgi:phosphoglycerate kinase